MNTRHKDLILCNKLTIISKTSQSLFLILKLQKNPFIMNVTLTLEGLTLEGLIYELFGKGILRKSEMATYRNTFRNKEVMKL